MKLMFRWYGEKIDYIQIQKRQRSDGLSLYITKEKKQSGTTAFCLL